MTSVKTVHAVLTQDAEWLTGKSHASAYQATKVIHQNRLVNSNITHAIPHLVALIPNVPFWTMVSLNALVCPDLLKVLIQSEDAYLKLIHANLIFVGSTHFATPTGRQLAIVHMKLWEIHSRVVQVKFVCKRI